MGGARLLMPRARETGLIVREVEDETIVYVLESNQAHCLNPISAAVWKQCDGTTTVPEILHILRDELGASVGEDTVWRTLAELGQSDLLEEQVPRPATHAMSRREMMQRSGVAAVVALPLITSLAIPPAAMAASTCGGSSGSVGCPCAGGSQCAAGCCTHGVCQTPTGNRMPDNSPCNGNGNCCSGNCVITAGKGVGTCMP